MASGVRSTCASMSAWMPEENGTGSLVRFHSANMCRRSSDVSNESPPRRDSGLLTKFPRSVSICPNMRPMVD